MNRERMEIGWYAVRPFLFYIVLFITIQSVLMRLLESALLASSIDMTIYYDLWYELAETAIIGVSAAGAAVPVLREGRREVMVTRSGSARAWISKRKDSRMLMAMLPAGTICLSAFLNLILAGNASYSAAGINPAAVPLSAAVYGLLTPFTEELVYRGLVWHRLRRGFSPLPAALLSSALFGIAHGNIPQALYGFAMGMVFSLSYELTRRFEVPYLLHCTCNLAVLAASYAGWGEVLHNTMWILFFAVGSIAVFGYWAKRLRDTNYKLY